MMQQTAEAPVAATPADSSNGTVAPAPVAAAPTPAPVNAPPPETGAPVAAAPAPAPRLTMLEGMKVEFDAKVGLQPVRLVRREDRR